MAYSSDKEPDGLTALTSLDAGDVFVVGDISDASEVAKYITKANLITDLGSSFAPSLGADDNYVSDAEKAALHAAVTVTDSSEINFTLTGQDITADIVAGSIDETKLDASVNSSLDLADSALQAAAIGTTVQAYDADLTTWAGITPGTGVGTALAVNVGTAGAFITNGGALGTPSSGTLTNCSGLPLSGVVDSTSEALGVGSLELGHASDTTISRTGAGAIAVEGVGVALNSTSLTHTASTLELGHASDTTISRVSAGVVAVEGNNVILANTTATRSLVLTASGGNPTTTSGCASPAKVEAGTNDVDYFVMDFDATTNEYAFWNVVMPDNYDGGTVTATFYWTSAAGSAGNVIWGLQGRAFNNDEAIDQAWGTAQEVTDAWIANGDVHITSATAAITLGGTPAGGEYVALRAYRNAASGSDTLAGDARLLSVKVDYGINAYSE